MRNRNALRNKCEKHGVLEIDEIYIRDGEPKCNICHKTLIFSDAVEAKIVSDFEGTVQINGGETMAESKIREVRDSLAEKLLAFAKRLDTGVKDDDKAHLKMIRKSVSRVHFLLTKEIDGVKQ